ncbi:hypothetical protein C8R46DRAFT_1039211 [Mycena filopes]|nr:hypothetical protein C8R46DRAFT_1039211 [Mycena filopes]
MCAIPLKAHFVRADPSLITEVYCDGDEEYHGLEDEYSALQESQQGVGTPRKSKKYKDAGGGACVYASNNIQPHVFERIGFVARALGLRLKPVNEYPHVRHESEEESAGGRLRMGWGRREEETSRGQASALIVSGRGLCAVTYIQASQSPSLNKSFLNSGLMGLAHRPSYDVQSRRQHHVGDGKKSIGSQVTCAPSTASP